MLLSRKIYVLMSLATVALCYSAWAQEPGKTQQKTDPAKIEGSFIATSGERDGKALTEDQLKGVTFRFDADKLAILDRTGKEVHKCHHTIDTSTKPWKINMKSDSAADAKTVVGLIEHDGDTIKIIYPLDGGETPTEFKTKEKQEMYVLKAQK